MSSEESWGEMNLPTSMAELAAYAQTDLPTLRRRLLALQADNPELPLMRKIGGLWHVDIQSLHKCWPEWGRRIAKRDEVIAMCDKVYELQQEVAKLRGRVRSLERRLSGRVASPRVEEVAEACE